MSAYVQIVNAYFALGKTGRSQGGQQSGKMDAAAHAGRCVFGWIILDAKEILGSVASMDERFGNVVIYGKHNV